MSVVVTSKEICRLIEANKERVKYLIKSKKIGQEMEMYGFKLINMFKVGRDNMYELEPYETNKWAKYQFDNRIKMRLEHTIYVKNRLLTDLNVSRRELVKILGITISETTGKRYDDLLVDCKALNEHTKSNHCYNWSFIENAVYRMLDEDGEVIYIGKTSSLKTRIQAHSTDKKEDDWFHGQVKKIEYVSFEGYGDCSIVEMYLITKYKPKYNRDFSNWETTISIPEIDNLEWKELEMQTDVVNSITYYTKGEKYDEILSMVMGEENKCI